MTHLSPEAEQKLVNLLILFEEIKNSSSEKNNRTAEIDESINNGTKRK